VRRIRVRIDSLVRDPTGRPGIHLSCPTGARPAPGQCALAVLPGQAHPARTALFPTRLDPQGFTADLPEGADWPPGADLDVLTPVGNGFSPPPSARRWLLAAIGVPPGRLLPLIDRGLARGAAVVLCAAARPAGLPPAVEVVLNASEAVAWADFLAADLAPEGVPNLRRQLLGADQPTLQLPRAAQVLVTPPMPCGLGVCGACAVNGRRRWQLACLDGPVFDLHTLDE